MTLEEQRSPAEDQPGDVPPPVANRPPAQGVVPAVLAVAVTGIALLPWLVAIPRLQAALCLLQVSIAAAGIAKSAVPVPRPIALVTFVFIFSWLGVAPIYQLSHGRAAWLDSSVLQSPDVTQALVLMVLATAILFIGLLRPLSSRTSARATHMRILDPPRSVCLGYLLACLALTPPAVSALGGVAGMFSSRSDRAEALGQQGLVLDQVGGLALALVGILPGALATAAAYLTLVRVINQVRSRGWLEVSAVDAGMLVVALGLVVLLANPFINTRALSAAALGSLVLLILRPRSRRAGVWMAVVLLVGTLVAYPAANFFRGTEAVSSEPGFQSLASQDFDGFQQVINTIGFVDDNGHTWGTHTLSGILYIVPRSIWADKERPASIDVAAHRGYVFTNLSLPLPAEWYLDFGPVGMCVGLFFLAAGARRCDEAWTADPRSGLAMLAPYASLAALSMIRGPIGSNGPVYLTNLGLIALGLLAASHSTAEPITEERRRDTASSLPGQKAISTRPDVGRTRT